MYRADGSLFESLDGGLNGDEWKQFAQESGQVWYVGGTDADDVITVDFVNEPGLLGDHHLVTRLTNNNGNFSFAAQRQPRLQRHRRRRQPVCSTAPTSR